MIRAGVPAAAPPAGYGQPHPTVLATVNRSLSLELMTFGRHTSELVG